MPTRKIADPPPPPCRHPEHSPPSMRVFEPGTYEHTCPACGARMVFHVPKVTLTQFDPSLSRGNPQNREAARDHGLRWSRRLGCYVDTDGCPTRDRFGQVLG